MYLYIYTRLYAAISIYVCIQKIKLTENRKQKFVFFGRQMINGNRSLLSQQTCPSMIVAIANPCPTVLLNFCLSADKENVILNVMSFRSP